MKMTKVILVSLLFVLVVHSFEFGKKYSAILDSTTQTWKVVEGVQPGFAAWAIFRDQNNEKGWYILDVISNQKQDDVVQAYGAGYVEGSLTQPQMWDAWMNFWEGNNYTMNSDVVNWSIQNEKFILTSIKQHASDNGNELAEYWSQINLIMEQFNGMLDGYNANAPSDQQLTHEQFLLYQLSSGDLIDLNAMFGGPSPPLTPEQIMFNSHCSSLVKLTPDNSELYASHVTWTGFTNLLRIYKHYDFPYHLSSTKSKKISFSSDPGSLPSGDDWYITDTKLVVMETTNSIMNQSLYNDYVTVNSVPYWIRVIVANRMASSGDQWVHYFSLYNSGTYNNQWMIVDYKLFSSGEPLVPNTFWVAEQIPGYVISSDMSNHLSNTGYWSSYNIPYFPFVYNISGYPEYYNKYGNSFSYEKCPRAQIFTRDHNTVEDLTTLKKIMRYNKWQTDPLSLGDACNSISARCDLNGPNGELGAFGAIDCKLSDSSMVSNMKSEAVAGPTWDSQPVFAWTEEWQSLPHYGMTEVYAFKFTPMKPYLG